MVNFRALKQAIFPNKHLKKYLPSLELLFSENGHSFYKFKGDTALPVIRMLYTDKMMELRSCGLSGQEIDNIIVAFKKSLSKGASGISEMGYLITALEQRQSMVLHKDILLNIAAYMIIRDDEDPSIVDAKIHSEKLELFLTKSEGGGDAYDFFISAALKPLSDSANMSKEEFTELWENNLLQIKILKGALNQLSAS
jgi:hypothetical protein